MANIVAHPYLQQIIAELRKIKISRSCLYKSTGRANAITFDVLAVNCILAKGY